MHNNRYLISYMLSALLLLTCAIETRAQSFRFAQLTDLHLSPVNAAPTEDLLKSIAQINATDSIDFVLITGDLTEEGDRGSLLRLKEYLGLLKMPYHIVLGNHETKWSDSGCTAFSEIFGDERIAFHHKGFLFLGFNSGPLMRMAYGHVAPQDIAWMKNEMQQAQCPTILFSHYPMLDGDVDNWYEVTDAVRPYNVRLFIGGHYHACKRLSYDGIPGILMRSNLRDKDGKPGYGIYEVTADSIRVYTQRIGEKKQAWTSFSLHTPYYDRNGKAEHYPDYSINNTYRQVKPTWQIESEAGIYCSPATDGQQVYVADDLGRLTAYRLKDGKRLWQYAEARKRIVGAPAIANDIVVFGSADRTIYAIAAQSGSLLWKYQAKEPVLGAVTIAPDAHGKNTVYIGASDHCMYALDLLTGKEMWKYNQVKGYIETRPLIVNGQVIFGAWDNNLYALNQTDGKEMWKWDGGLTRMHFSPAAVWPVATQNRVFIADPQRALTAIDLANGKTIWRTFQSKVRESLGISQDGERIYGKTMNDSIVCYSTHSDQPRQLWATDARFGYEHAPAMLPECEGIVYASTCTGVIMALDGKSGQLLWKHKVGNSLLNTVVPIGKKRVLYTSTDGKIGMLKWK